MADQWQADISAVHTDFDQMSHNTHSDHVRQTVNT